MAAVRPPPSRKIARVILNPGAHAGCLDHLDIELRSLFDPLRFQQLVLLGEFGQPAFQFFLDLLAGLLQCRARCHIMRIGKNGDAVQRSGFSRRSAGRSRKLPRSRRQTARSARPGPQGVPETARPIPAHPKGTADEIGVIAPVLQLCEFAQQLLTREILADGQRLRHCRIGFHRPDSIDAGHRGDDDHVIALEQRPRRRVPHPVDLFIDRRLLLDVGVGARNIGLGLVIVVIGDKIFDRIVGEQRLHLAIELRCQRLVRCEDQRRPLDCRDHMCCGEGLARSGHAEQHLVTLALLNAGNQLGDRSRLVTGLA